ncbi:MAG: DUF1501 domain-containing protein [Bacteroidetes bacterium]|nr:DUF1501 domain-containing protein [Bacteroidota bacterium]
MCDSHPHSPHQTDLHPDEENDVLREGDCLEHGEKHTLAHASWSRRQFLQGLGLAAAGSSFGFGASTVQAFSTSPLLQSLARSKTDRILVLVQLSGGNDGLNTVVPYSDPEYYRIRPSISIPGNSVLKLSTDIGLHPSLTAFERLYQEGFMQVLNGVGYETPSLSHFSSTDVWLTGDASNNIGSTGWLGRYLTGEYPEYVTQTPTYPLALQLGNGAPLLFQGSSSRMGIAFPNLSLLSQFAKDGILFDESFAPSNSLGSELSFMRSVANDSFQFAESIQAASTSGSNLGSYPSSTGLSAKLAVTAKLIRGRLGANIYHLNLGGFDTHSGQLTRHQALMQELSGSIGAFMDDLKVDGWDKEVLVMTFSEFGRRTYQNGSGGTDHGTSAPIFMFGGGVAGGLIGAQPSLTQLAPGGNMHYSIDFRALYGSILKDWFGLETSEVQSLIAGSFTPLSILNSSFVTNTEPKTQPTSVRLLTTYPNPFQTRTTIDFELDQPQVIRIEVFDVVGKLVASVLNGPLSSGRHQLPFEAGSLPSGTYFLRMTTNAGVQTKSLSLVR